MKKIETILKKENYNFKVNEQISDGETSQIFLGEFNNIKSIFKLSKKNKFKLIINEYFKNGVIQKIASKNISPKVLFHDLKAELIIYEYFEKDSSDIQFNNFYQLGKKLKKLHEITPSKKIKTFENQFNVYLNVSLPELGNKYFKGAVDLFNELNVNKEKHVLCHNDLDSSNVMFKNNKIVFIDFEYLSTNSKYSDLSKLIDSLNLKKLEKDKLFKGYGIDEIDESINVKIKKWSLMNIYTELIWANYINEHKKNHFDNDYINFLKQKIKQQRQ
tara:strand:- start:304 stop:1125 length:822 start_codon:yes stop_codon:yes gene_type:complete